MYVLHRLRVFLLSKKLEKIYYCFGGKNMDTHENCKAQQIETTETDEKDVVDASMDYDQIEGDPFVY